MEDQTEIDMDSVIIDAIESFYINTKEQLNIAEKLKF